jgi:hypothetical protein
MKVLVRRSRLEMPQAAVLWALVIALVLPLTGCLDFLNWLEEDGGTPGSGDAGSAGACGGLDRGCLTGNVVDESNTAIPSVGVSVGGSALGKSNEQGWYFASGVQQGARVSVCFAADGFVTRCRTVVLSGGQSLTMTPTVLTRPAVKGPITGSTGGAVSDGATGAKFQLPPGGACQASGSGAVTGVITCSLAPLDVTRTAQRDLAPGDFTGQSTSGQSVQLVSSGMMDITCVDAAGARVNLCAGTTADVQIPIFGTCTDEAKNPATIQSWAFNERTGLWEEYRTFTKTCGGAGANYYAGKIGHLSYWNADGAYQVACLTGTVMGNGGAPVEGALVKCNGTDYQGGSEAYSAAGGRFCVRVKPGAGYSCVVAKGTFKTETLTGTASPTPSQCGGSSCTDLGSIALAEPIVRTVLSWGQSPSDLDSHFVGRDGTHVSYSGKGALTSSPFIGLDTDDTTSFGPEVTTVMGGVAPGTYRFCVHNYSGESSGAIAASGATVNLFAGAQHRVYSVPAANPSAARLWRVYEAIVGVDQSVSVRDLDDYVVIESDLSAACLK